MYAILAQLELVTSDTFKSIAEVSIGLAFFVVAAVLFVVSIRFMLTVLGANNSTFVRSYSGLENAIKAQTEALTELTKYIRRQDEITNGETRRALHTILRRFDDLMDIQELLVPEEKLATWYSIREKKRAELEDSLLRYDVFKPRDTKEMPAV